MIYYNLQWKTPSLTHTALAVSQCIDCSGKVRSVHRDRVGWLTHIDPVLRVFTQGMFRRLLCCRRLLLDTAVNPSAFSVDSQRQHLEVIIGGEALEEAALGLHEAVELTTVDLTGAITVSLCDHVLHLLVIDVLSELLSHARGRGCGRRSRRCCRHRTT